jgi:hypothetical protein
MKEKPMTQIPAGFTSRPVPDPTVLTTQQLEREIKALREIIEARILAGENRMDATIKVVRDAIDKRPNEIDLRVDNLHALMNEKFGGLSSLMEEKFSTIAIQFRERDTRVEQTAKDTKVAVDAALQAAEKAVGKQNESFALATSKSEAATTKQIDQLGNLFQTSTKALEDKINDIKDRVNNREGIGIGRDKQHVEQNDATRINLAAAALACTVAALVGGLIAHFVK